LLIRANVSRRSSVCFTTAVSSWHHGWITRADLLRLKQIARNQRALASDAEDIRDLRKSLTPTGRVAIIDFRKDSPEGPPVDFRFTPQQIEDEMRQAGFRLAATHDFLPRQHFLVFR
jgi:hypothetical protein